MPDLCPQNLVRVVARQIDNTVYWTGANIGPGDKKVGKETAVACVIELEPDEVQSRNEVGERSVHKVEMSFHKGQQGVSIVYNTIIHGGMTSSRHSLGS